MRYVILASIGTGLLLARWFYLAWHDTTDYVPVTRQWLADERRQATTRGYEGVGFTGRFKR